MPRHSRSKLTPWIEPLILNYSSPEGSNGSGRLKAHVIGVGQMSQSQAQGSDGPTGLLFLSDGVLQIPAVLTASAWEHLQEQEDRECFTSLVNTTVCIQDYQLQFHMAPEQTKCRFFLTVGELATTAAGPIKDNTPCCTSLPSIRLKICKTWRDLLNLEAQDSQKSQCGFDLSELLGEWHHDCLHAVLKDVQERLMVVSSRPVSPQPSTSTFTSLPTDAVIATSWDVDRVRYKEGKCFTVPVKCLLIPEVDAQLPQTPPSAGSRAQNGHSVSPSETNGALLQVSKPPHTTQPSVDDAEWRIVVPAGVERGRETQETSPLPAEDCTLHEVMISGLFDSNIEPLSNPWDIFPPPCNTSSSSDASPEATPTHSLHCDTSSRSKPDHAEIFTSTQHHVHTSHDSQQPSEHSYFPPYQKPPHSSTFPSTASVSPSKLSPATNGPGTITAQQNLSPLEQESLIIKKDMRESSDMLCRKAKRKRSEPTPEALAILREKEEEELQVNPSPPSWLFDTPGGCRPEDGSSYKQGQAASSRKTLNVHSDGSQFSFSYRTSRENLQDCSRFNIPGLLLSWAAKYLLVPKQTDGSHSTPAASNQTPSDKPRVS